MSFLRKDLMSLFFLSLFLLTACSENEAPANIIEEPKVYVVYWEYDETTSNGIVKLWQDGSVSNISDTSKDAWANDIFITDKNDVYIGGYIFGNSLTPTLWKNGVVTSLTEGIEKGTVNDVYVHNNDVYLAGNSATVTSPDRATLWKNKKPTILSNILSKATKVIVHNNDVYVIGSIGVRPVVWKNGEKTFLTDGTHTASVEDIAVYDNNVYILGKEHNGTKHVIKLWKNGVATNITDGNFSATPSSIAIEKGDIYVAGQEKSAGYIPKVWKNGVATNLTDGKKYAFPNDLFVFENTTYTAGSISNTKKEDAVLWKNTTMINITKESNARAMAVFVK
ncbi:conserved exported protein of unknown function [Tenacibaculum sp. 190524A02b]|uniref:hypothetical protein n=1 Tax=Tenacibaculum vairaonense TaxID=3137860 RepID=UPI0032B2463D